MQLLTFQRDGAIRYGALVEGGLVDLTVLLPYPTLAALLAADALAEAAAALPRATERLPLDQVQVLGPLPEARLFCIGANYPKPHPLGGQVSGPAHISFFIKHHAALVPHGEDLTPPEVSEQYDYEGELAVVIGRGGHRIAESAALSHVAGYTILNDGSVRDWQKHSVCAGKNFHRSGSWGPFLTTADVLPDPAELRLQTRLNGALVQDSFVSAMFFGVPAIIAYLSTITPLLPGDVIATGSPEGTGSTLTPPRFLRSGDTVEISITGLGTLSNRVA